MGAQALFSKQEGSGYPQRGRGRGKRKGRWGGEWFRRRGHDSLNKSTGRPHKTNQTTSCINSGNLKSRFDKTKVKCYNS
jgi:hypothetical protein